MLKNLFSMQEDELSSNECEAVLNEDEGKGGEIPSGNQLSDKTAEGQEGKPSSPPCSFIYILIKKNCVMQVVIFSICFYFRC